MDAECEWHWSAFGLDADTEDIACCQRCGKHLLDGEPAISPLVGGHQAEAAYHHRRKELYPEEER